MNILIMTNNNDQERREYFRVNDQIYLEYECISEEEHNKAPELLADLENSSFKLSADFATLNNSIHPLLSNIKQLHPDIGEYLDFLNQKIDRVNQLLLVKETNFDESKVIPANLSASGISFASTDTFEASQHVKIELVLLPEKVGILIFGHVVSSADMKSDGNILCIHFDHIRPEDRELMIKHNLNKQMADIREKNDNN